MAALLDDAQVVAELQTGAGHGFAQPAVGCEIAFEPANLAFQQTKGDLRQTGQNIGADGGIIVFNPSAEGVVFARGGRSAEVGKPAGIGVRLGPFLEAADDEEVAVVLQQFPRLAMATPVSLISVSLETAEAMLPSTMFCLPERAA